MKDSRILGVLLLSIAFTSCGEAVTTRTASESESSRSPAVSSASPTELADCESLWAETREEYSEASPEAGDGEARRAADGVILECLDDLPQSEGDGEPGSYPAEFECPESVTESRPTEFVLVFTCGPESDMVTVVRSMGGSTRPSPEDVARAYFKGPSPAEIELGIYSPLGDVLNEWAFEVSESEGVLNIDFESGAAKQIGAMGSTQGALLEIGLRETLLRVGGSERLVVSEDGACEPIWETAGMSCPVMRRK